MKREEEMVIHSLGFPVILRNIPVREFHGEQVIDINWDRLQHIVLWALAHKPVPLSGNEIRFVRHYMEKTLKEFADLCEVGTHQTVMNWESKEEDATGMHRSTEIVLRARILDVVPREVWEQFEAKRKVTKRAVSKLLSDVSNFQEGPARPLSLFGDESRAQPSRYAYA